MIRHSRPRLAILALATSALLASFLQTIMTPLVPVLPAQLDESAAAVSWILTASLLAACASAPTSGRVGDLFGKRLTMLALLVLIVVGSIVGALAQDLPGVIVARALQGVGLGVMALNIGAIRDVVPPALVPGGLSVVTACNGIGGGLGLPASALVAQHLDWHGLFWLSGGLAIVSGLAILLLVPETPRTPDRGFDLLGAVGLAIGLCAILLAISQGDQWGWTSPATVGCAVGGALVLGLWGMHEARARRPLVDLKLLASRPVLIVNLVALCVGFCWLGVPAVVARLLQSAPGGGGAGLGLDMVTTSLLIVPTGAMILLCAPIARRVERRKGPQVVMRVGTATLAATFALAALLPTPAPVWVYSIVAGLVGVGSGFAFAGLPIALLRSVPVTATGTATALNAVMRWIGSTLSAGILGAILAALVVRVGPDPVPTSPAFHLAFAVAAAVGLVGFALALAMPRTEART